LRQQFQKLGLLPDYFRTLAKEWLNILFGETLLAVLFLLWWALANPSNPRLILVFVVAMFVAGYYAWRADHSRLQQKIEVTRVRTHSWPHRDGGKGTQFYFEVVNKSEAITIHGVRVQLLEIIPKIENSNWLPIALHLQHDNPVSGVFAQSFDLHPREPRNIDLFSTVAGSSVAHIAHIVSGVNLRVPVTGRCRLRGMITAEDVPVLFTWFAVWVDEKGTLQCEIE
jgi:hypothetical protein